MKTVKNAVKEFKGVWPLDTKNTNYWFAGSFSNMHYEIDGVLKHVCSRKEFEDYAKMMELNKLNNKGQSDEPAISYISTEEYSDFNFDADAFNVEFAKNWVENNIQFTGVKEAVKELNEHSKEVSAIKTLESMGYSHKGGVMWKPPLGERKNKEAVKPVYTQEMADNGELPPVGSMVNLVEDTGFYSANKDTIYTIQTDEAVTVIGHCQHPESKNMSVTLFASKCGFTTISNQFVKPIDTRTDEEKLIDEMENLITEHCSSNGTTRDLPRTFLEHYDITPK